MLVLQWDQYIRGLCKLKETITSGVTTLHITIAQATRNTNTTNKQQLPQQQPGQGQR
jgi:hypothetical protein